MPASIFDRRALLRGAALTGGGLAVGGVMPGWAMSGTMGMSKMDMSKMGKAQPTGIVSGERIALTVGHVSFAVGGRNGHAITVNGSLPGPLIRLKEGQNVRLDVTNNLAEDTSIHWHGILLPFQYDGVPGISFPGIKPGQTYSYEFPIRQAGTYWYHSHSNMQEAVGMFGAIVIDPAGPDPVAYDREHVIVLSD